MRLSAAFPATVLLVLLGSCRGKSQSYKDNPKLTPLMNAAAHHDLRRVQDLLTHGANVGQRTANGETALYEAIEDEDPGIDNLPTVDALLKAGADPNQPEIFDMSPLEVALTREAGSAGVVPRLLQAGAHVPRTCGKGDSLLSLEVQDIADPKITEELIQAGAPVNCRDSGSALYAAAINGEVEIVQLLLANGADPVSVNPKDRLLNCSDCDAETRAHQARVRQLLTDAQRPHIARP
jgi:ankyrin repeat protein